MKNMYQEKINTLEEGELIIGVKVGSTKKENIVCINDKLDDYAQSVALAMLAHGIYVTAVKQAEKHGVPMGLAKMMAELPIRAAFKTFEVAKTDKRFLEELKIQNVDDDCDKSKAEVEAEPEPKEEKQLQKDKAELAKDIDEVFANLSPSEQELLSKLITSMVMRAMEDEGKDE